MGNFLAVIFINKIQDLLLVSGSSAPSPIERATPVAVVNCLRAICSVCLSTVGNPGACPDHGDIVESWNIG